MKTIEQELAKFRLKIFSDTSSAACVGIGGDAMGLGRISVPAGIAGVTGLIRFNVVKDTLAQPIPPLLPIKLQTYLAFNIDPVKSECTLQHTPMPDVSPGVRAHQYTNLGL